MSNPALTSIPEHINPWVNPPTPQKRSTARTDKARSATFDAGRVGNDSGRLLDRLGVTLPPSSSVACQACRGQELDRSQVARLRDVVGRPSGAGRGRRRAAPQHPGLLQARGPRSCDRTRPSRSRLPVKRRLVSRSSGCPCCPHARTCLSTLSRRADWSVRWGRWWVATDRTCPYGHLPTGSAWASGIALRSARSRHPHR